MNSPKTKTNTLLTAVETNGKKEKNWFPPLDGIYCREYQIQALRNLLGDTPYDECPLAVFVQGDISTGKSLVVNKCLKEGHKLYAYFNCAEIDIKHCYESVINQLINYEPSPDTNFEPFASCSNYNDFVEELLKIEDKFSGIPIYIVVDHCEILLKRNDVKVLEGLFRLSEITKIPICPLFISNLPWGEYKSNRSFINPIVINFPKYTLDEMALILKNLRPLDIPEKFFDNFLALIRGMFFNLTSDLRVLGNLVKQCFVRYYHPIENGSLTRDDTKQLWDQAQPYFREQLSHFYVNIYETELKPDVKFSKKDYVMEFPHNMKYFMLAAYIASYNPPSEDHRFFVKKSSGKKKKLKPYLRKNKRYLRGPKTFSLERLAAIATVIMGRDELSGEYLACSHIATMEHMRFVLRMSADRIDFPSYRCNFDLAFAEYIASTVSFPLKNYLVDFIDG